MVTTLRDIARLAGVSTATVSYVLNGKGRSKGISEETATRIREIADAHGYVPNSSARSLRKGRYNLIALISPHCADFYADLLLGIEQEGDKHEFQVLFASTFNSFEREENYVRTLLARRIEGAIVLPIDVGKGYLELFQRNRVPTVYFRQRDKATLRTKFMTFDDGEGARMATRHLLERGCRRLAFCSTVYFLSYEHDRIVHEARVAGFRAALAEAGLPFDDSMVWLLDEQAPDYGTDALARVRGRRVDGIVGLSDRTCVSLLRVLREGGVTSPGEVKVTGFDDSELARFNVPSLTSVALPKAALGAQMVEALMRMVESGRQETDEVLLCPSLVVRESTDSQCASGEPTRRRARRGGR